MDSNKEQTSSLKRLASYIKPYKSAFIVAIIGMLGYAGVDTLFFSQIETLIDEGLTQQDSSVLLWGAVFVPVFFIVRGLFNFISTYFLSWVGFKVVTRMRQQLFEHLMKLPVAFHDNHSTGDLISKITYDTQQVAEASSRALLILIRDGGFVVGLLCLMFYQSWQLSLVFLVIGPVIAKFVGVVSKRFRVVSGRIQTAMGNVTTTAEQMINGHKVVVMHEGQKLESKRFGEINNITRNQNMKLVSTRAISTSVIQFIASLSLAMVLVIASFPEMLEAAVMAPAPPLLHTFKARLSEPEKRENSLKNFVIFSILSRSPLDSFIPTTLLGNSLINCSITSKPIETPDT